MVYWAVLNVIPVFALRALKSVGGASCHLLKADVCVRTAFLLNWQLLRDLTLHNQIG